MYVQGGEGGRARRNQAWAGGGDLHPFPAGLCWGPQGTVPPSPAAVPPVVQMPTPTLGLSAQVHLGVRVGLCLRPAPCPRPALSPGRELTDPRLARGSGGWSPGQGASPVTFPRGPDTLTRPLRLLQALGGGLVGVQLGSPSSAWRPGVQPSCQVTLTQLPLRPREWVPSCLILQI